jgi:ribonuclease PH
MNDLSALIRDATDAAADDGTRAATDEATYSAIHDAIAAVPWQGFIYDAILDAIDAGTSERIVK